MNNSSLSAFQATAWTFTGAETFAPTVSSSGIRTALTVTGAADTGRTAATEQTDVYINLARTVTWAAGAGPLAAQRAIRIAAPTYAGNAGTPLTITKASTFEIDNAPQAGEGITLTHPWAFRVAAGASNFVGDVWMNSMLSVTGSIWASIIADTSGNAVLACPGAPSAVNYITVTNAATGNAVELSASGDDAAVSADFAPKGTGNLTLRSGGGTARIAINNTGIGFNAAAPTAQSGAIADAAGGATVDAEARAALNTLLAYLRLRGDIAT